MSSDSRDEPRADGSRQIVPGPPAGLPDDPDLKTLWKEMETQTDRGLAVLAAAYLEWRVREAIKCCLPCWNKEVESIFGTDTKPGELSYKYQCRMVYSLGLIGPICLKDLDRVGRIRNKFAHRPSVRSFDHEAVRDLCDSLETPEAIMEFARRRWKDAKQAPMGRRRKYEFTVQQISFLLWSIATDIARKSAKHEPPDVYY